MASASLKRVHLEPGGKAPVLIFDDADLELFVKTLKVAGFANSGQDCTAACRLYARDKVYDRLLSELATAAKSIQLGAIQGRNDGDGAADLPRGATPARERVRTACPGDQATWKLSRAVLVPAGAGYWFLAHGPGWSPPYRRDRPEGGLRTRRHRHPLQGR